MKSLISLRFEKLSVLILLGCVFSLALFKLADNDVWTHLVFGKWIWENREIPIAEPFITTGQPYPYNNWLFGLTLYLVYLTAGFSGLVLFKAAIVSTIFFALFRDALRPAANPLLAFVAMTLTAIALQERFVERPELVMMICLACSILFVNAYHFDRRRYLYWLPLLHLIWANSHTSIMLMLVPFLAYLVGGYMQIALHRRFVDRIGSSTIGLALPPTKRQLSTVSMVFLVSLIAALFSPYFLDQFFHSIGALKSTWLTQEILELQPPRGSRFWLLVVYCIVVVMSFYANRKNLFLPHIAMAIPFLAMPFLANRFIWFVGLTSVFLIRNLSQSLNRLPGAVRILGRPAVTFILVAPVIVLGGLRTLELPPFQDYLDRKFGLGAQVDLPPEGAAKYLDRRAVDGMVFTDYGWGGYLNWRDHPRRRSFIDGRGFTNDVLLDRWWRSRSQPKLLNELQREFGFESIVLAYPKRRPNLDNSLIPGDGVLASRGWALVYWDDRFLVYLRRGGPYQHVIDDDEYRIIQPAKGLGAKAMQSPRQAIDELNRNIDETGSVRATYLLGELHNRLGRHEDAIAVLGNVVSERDSAFYPAVRVALGDAFAEMEQWNKALEHYERVPTPRSTTARAALHRRLGTVHAAAGRSRVAIDHLAEAIALNPDLVSAYFELSRLYSDTGNLDRAREVLAKAKAGERRVRSAQSFQAATQAYLAGNIEGAIGNYEFAIREDPENALAYSNLAYAYFDLGDLDKARALHSTAIQLDPGLAESHYGLALIHKRHGDWSAARRHWQEYLRLQPTGRFALRARQELEALP